MPKIEPDKSRSASGFVTELFNHLLDRAPSETELKDWIRRLTLDLSEADAFLAFVRSAEYQAKRRVKPGHPAGHFYSPIVDPSSVREYWARSSSLRSDELPGIKMSIERMAEFWKTNLSFISSVGFTKEKTAPYRYFYDNGNFPPGDSVLLAAMITAYKPRRIIEIGSGFSSAVMLDTLDSLQDSTCTLTCIEPYPGRLKGLLRPVDHERVCLLDKEVQSVPLTVFETLDKDDFLFIDSSHVMKTGSDVHYELFSILPVLREGVLIHFHDIPNGFEMREAFLFNKGWSWNECYAVRAFLMYNHQYEILFSTDTFSREQRNLYVSGFADPSNAFGSSLWIRRRAMDKET